MKTIWFCGNEEEKLTTTAEFVGEELINRDKCVELIVESEVREILGRGLKDTPEDKATFTDRLGFLGNLLYRNGIFALIISPNASVEDRKIVKQNYANYVQINIGDFKDLLCDLDLSLKDIPKENAKKIIEYLIFEKIIPEQCQTVYSEDEEEEIRKRLEDLGYV
jgi:hypothetical protein